VRAVFLPGDSGEALAGKQVDLLLSAPPDFWERLENGDRPAVQVLQRDGDDRSKQAALRVYALLGQWKKHLTEVRLIRSGLPAGREEIVLGKFLTIWVFSAGTALLNLASMGMSTWQFSNQLPHGALSVATLAWCVLLALPLSAFFSAVSLAIGAYARSSKEGQYYLMPLFLVTTPLIALTFAPGVELNPFYSLVPVTGVALLMQRLMTAPLDKVPWLYFVPVL